MHYRSPGVFSLREWSPQIHAEFHGFRVTWVSFKTGRLVSTTGLSPSTEWLSSTLRLPSGMVTVHQSLRSDKNDPATPTTHRRKAVTRNRFRLFPFRSPLLGESHSLSSPPLTEMFQFSGLPLSTLCVQMEVTQHNLCRVAPFGYLRVSLLAAIRSFSSLATPFIGSRCQGIHRAPFLT